MLMKSLGPSRTRDVRRRRIIVRIRDIQAIAALMMEHTPLNAKTASVMDGMIMSSRSAEFRFAMAIIGNLLQRNHS